MLKFNRRAQNLIEYTLVLTIVATVLLAMQVYFKRGVQAVVRVPVDNLGLFAATHDELMSSDPNYVKFVNNIGYLPTDDTERKQYVASYYQNIAIKQETDPKYGVLQAYKTKIGTDQSITITTPAESGGERKTNINKWEEATQDQDVINPRTGETVTGKVFYQELPD